MIPKPSPVLPVPSWSPEEASQLLPPHLQTWSDLYVWWASSSTILHPARSTYKHLQPRCFLSPVVHRCLFAPPPRDLREVSPCLVPPAGAPATAVTLKNASDKCIADAAFCLGWMYGCMSGLSFIFLYCTQQSCVCTGIIARICCI